MLGRSKLPRVQREPDGFGDHILGQSIGAHFILRLTDAPLGLSQAAQLPRRHRGRHLLAETRLRLGALHLAWARPLQDLCLVLCGGLQSRALHPPQTGLTPLIGPRSVARRRAPAHTLCWHGPFKMLALAICTLVPSRAAKQRRLRGQNHPSNLRKPAFMDWLGEVAR